MRNAKTANPTETFAGPANTCFSDAALPIMNDASHEIETTFAAECDSDLCGAIYHVLHEKEAAMDDLNFANWPKAWVTHWSVWRHYWIWMMDGFESLWMVELEQLTLFQQCLIEIGDHRASEFLADSIQAVCPDRVGTEPLAFSDDIHQLANDWDQDAKLPWSNIEANLARYSRSKRRDFGPLCDALVARLITDKQK